MNKETPSASRDVSDVIVQECSMREEDVYVVATHCTALSENRRATDHPTHHKTPRTFSYSHILKSNARMFDILTVQFSLKPSFMDRETGTHLTALHRCAKYCVHLCIVHVKPI